MAVSVEPALLTFVIADVRGYTRFTVERGDEAGARLATTFAGIASETIQALSGRVVELRGDEVLAVFHSARQALRSAVALQEALAEATTEDLPLRVGIGIDAGEAIPVEGGYRGAALNLAARLCSLAGPGEVLASETVINLARKVEGLQYLDRGAADLKGFSSHVPVVQVLPESERQPQVAVEAETVRREQRLPIGGFLGALPSNPLVARDGELQRLLAAVHATQEGEGRMVLLTGEPGVGKTRLAQEATLHARNLGFLVGSGRCYEPEQNVPYYPFREALSMLYDAAPPGIRADVAHLWPYMQQLLPGNAEGRDVARAGDEEDQQRLFYAVSSFLEALAGSSPVALLLDDLHWADGSSLKLVQYIARHTRTSPVFILATYRDVEVGRQHPLERALRDLHREGLTEEIDVRRLGQEGTAALTAVSFGESEISEEFAALIHRHTEGNPFFTQEVLRTLVERGDVFEENGRWERRRVDEIEVPRSVRSTVGERVSRLDEEAQEILTTASVLGQTFLFDDLEGLSGRDERTVEDALEAAEAAGLVRTQGRDRYSFNHALTQQVLYEEIPPRRRRRLHLAAGEAMEGSKQADRRVAEMAWHFLEADESEKALVYALRAGDEANAVFAYPEAERHFRNALELARETGDRNREMEALDKLAHVVGTTGPFDEALRILREADQAAIELGDREVQRRVTALRFTLTTLQTTPDDEVLGRFDELLEDPEPSLGLATMCMARSRQAFGAGLYDESGAWAERAAEIARAIGSEFVLADAEARRGTWLSRRDRAASIRVLEEAIQLAERSGNATTLAYALNNLAWNHMLRGELRTNLHYRERSNESAIRSQSPVGLIFSNAMISQAHFSLGNLVKAREYADMALQRARRTERIWHTSYALYISAHLRAVTGEWEEAGRLVQEGREIASSFHDLQGMGYGRLIAGELSLLEGHPEEVIERYEETPADEVVQLERAVAAEAYVLSGQLDAAEQIADAMIRPDSWNASEGMRIRGMIAARRGEYDAAERDLLAGLELARTQEYRLEEGRCLLALGGMLEARGDRDGARERLGDALRLFREMAAHAYADRAEQALSELLAGQER